MSVLCFSDPRSVTVYTLERDDLNGCFYVIRYYYGLSVHRELFLTEDRARQYFDAVALVN